MISELCQVESSRGNRTEMVATDGILLRDVTEVSELSKYVQWVSTKVLLYRGGSVMLPIGQ